MSATKKYTWHKVADSLSELFPDSIVITERQVNGKKLCFTLHQLQVFACAGTCPHAGGKMTEGYVDALGNIVCPVHRYKFSLQTGRNSSGEGYFLKTYPVETRDEAIMVGFEERNLFDLFK